MFFKLLSDRRLKIILSPKDMSDLKISYSDLELACPITRSLVLGLLTQVEEIIDFDKEYRTLLVELYPTKPGGCVITYTAIAKPSKQFYPRQIFAFCDGYTAINACIAVFSRYSNLIYKSTLYRYLEWFYIGVSTIDGDSSPVNNLFDEYGNQMPGSALFDSYVVEHMEVILEEDALDTIYRMFCSDKQ